MANQAVVDIPANLVPYYFALGGPAPVSMLTREEARQHNQDDNDDDDAGKLRFLQVSRFNLRDGLSELGYLEIDVMCPNKDEMDLESLVGEPAMFAWACGTEDERKFRYFHGIVTRFAETGADRLGVFYHLQVMPRLWKSTLRKRCRIFQNLSVVDIVKKVLKESGLTQGQDLLDNGLTGDYQPREYCVQYRETDFQFVSRLMEEEGIYYYFDHLEDRDVLVLADTPTGHESCMPYDTVAAQAPQSNGQAAETNGLDSREELVRSFLLTQSLQPGKVKLHDYDFTNSTKKPIGQCAGKCTDEPEVYEFPGRFTASDRGAQLAKVRMQQFDAQTRIARGRGDFRSLAAGKTFDLIDHPREKYCRAYLCTSVSHSGTQESLVDAEGGVAGMGGTTYENHFECIPDDLPYRAPRVTPKPVIHGAQTAKVVGPSGEEIYTDKFLRVKVQFHWDLEGQEDENSSCWLRVVQPWADRGFGTVIIPRIGTEVLVEFLEGDPDSPIVNGVVYNDQHMPPFALPDNKMMTGIKSNSTPGGGGYNEISFNDAKDSELIHVHAQKNQTINVNNNETTTIGNNRRESVGNDETISIGHDRTETVDNDETITIHGNRTETVDKNESITIGLDRTEQVGGSEEVKIDMKRKHIVTLTDDLMVGGARSVRVGGAHSTTVVGYQSMTIGGYQKMGVSGNQAMQVNGDRKVEVKKDAEFKVDKNFKVSVGELRDTNVEKDDKLNVGKKLLIDAGDEITLKTGQSSLTMKKDGTITIKGKAIQLSAMQKIECKGVNVTIEGSAKVAIKGAMVNVEASGINTIKGSLVKIN